MRIPDFTLERYFAQWEFAAKHLLCASDIRGLYPMSELVGLADPELKALWKGLHLGYTKSTGHPLLRRGVRLDLRDHRTRRGADIRRCRGGEIFCLMNVLHQPGRSRHRHLAWLPEPVRDRPRQRSRDLAARAARVGRLGHRHRPAALRGPSDDPPHRRQHPTQPDRHDGRPDDL